MSTQDEKEEMIETSAYNPFPEPQTIPSGWDLSELTSMPQSDSDMEKADKGTQVSR